MSDGAILLPGEAASTEVLPDSRLRDRLKGIVRGFFAGVGFINWLPVFCANCGKRGPYVPEENCNFVFWMCTDCVDKWGAPYGTALMPDEVFWRKAHAEMIEKYGRVLTEQELVAVIGPKSTSPLAKLLRDRK